MVFDAKFPEFDEEARPPPSKPHALTSFNAKFGEPIRQKPNILDEIASLSGLDNFLAPSTARKFLKAIGIAAGMLLLATIAFTPHGMAQFFHHLGRSIAFALSPVGMRIVAFTLLVIIAFIIFTLGLMHYNELVALTFMLSGVVLGCIAGFGWWLNLVSSGWAVALGGVAFGILWLGTQLDYWEPLKSITPLPAAPPRNITPSPFPNARAATASDIHNALGGNKTPAQSDGKKYKRRD